MIPLMSKCKTKEKNSIFLDKGLFIADTMYFLAHPGKQLFFSTKIYFGNFPSPCFTESNFKLVQE